MKLLTKRKLPKPASACGYPISQLKAFFTKKQRKEFNRRFGVQTCALENGEIVLYPHDVERAVLGLGPLD